MCRFIVLDEESRFSPFLHALDGCFHSGEGEPFLEPRGCDRKSLTEASPDDASS